MMRVLVTAFGPYDNWSENASWLALVRLTQDLPANLSVTTRRYPVDFATLKRLLSQDLEAGFDVLLATGQAPGSSHIRLEQLGINIGGHHGQLPEQYQPLADDGPVAYRSMLPLASWAQRIRAAGIPAQVSHHAGTFLCNATLYWAHYWSEKKGLPRSRRSSIFRSTSRRRSAR
ncbi:MAG: pyroglutamyl-peptidase I [Pirellulales bacterium]